MPIKFWAFWGALAGLRDVDRLPIYYQIDVLIFKSSETQTEQNPVHHVTKGFAAPLPTQCTGHAVDGVCSTQGSPRGLPFEALLEALLEAFVERTIKYDNSVDCIWF